MSENIEKVSLQSIFRNMYDFVQSDPTWVSTLPLMESVGFHHRLFGPIRLFLCLDKRFHHGFQKEVFVLSLDVIVANGKMNQRVSVGESAKILADLASLCQDIEPLYAKLHQTYMGFDYPRHWA
ncbi:MAG: hypothetical protein JXA33_22665 [Anaerolineae bacterium]|nr:hypothetical protein [Anaerolineae bacterium]